MFNFIFKEKSQEELDRFVKEVLDKIHEKSGTRRRTMYRKGHDRTEPKNSFSIVYGYCNLGYLSPTKQRKKVIGVNNLYETSFLTKHPELLDIFQQLLDLYCDDDVTADQVHINKNWLSPPHKDSGNQNESYIIGLGDYTNGNLIIEKEDGDEEIDIHNIFIKFNGAKYTHYTRPFEGTRYSLVFYNHKINKI